MSAPGLATGRHALAELLAGLADTDGASSLRVAGLSMDSRRVRPGDLFLACAGSRGHGAAYIEEAVARGAVAVAVEPTGSQAALGALTAPQGRVVPLIPVTQLRRRAGEIADRFFDHPSKAMTVIGVTGTNGKTSVSQFVAQALSERTPCGVIGTLGAGLYGALVDTGHTTPDPIMLHAELAAMRDAGARHAVLEVSSHALDQGRVAGVRFDCGVFTNLTHEHLDYHGSLATYAAAKRRLLDLPGLRHAVINADDPTGRTWLEALHPALEVIAYGLGEETDLRGGELELAPEGLALTIDGRWGRGRLSSVLLGRFNAYNLLAAAGALLATGLPLAEVLQRLARVRTVPGRMERFGGGERPLAVVDYAHTPDALEHVLAALREHCRGRLWCVFGCGGDRDRGKRPLMGRVAETLADRVVLTDDNPRGEEPQSIVEAIRAGMRRPEAIEVIRDRAQAIAFAIDSAQAGDVVLVAGKGHETWQQIGSERRPFDDRAEVVRQLAGR